MRHDAERGRIEPETNIVIDYLRQHYPGPVTAYAMIDAQTAGNTQVIGDRAAVHSGP